MSNVLLHDISYWQGNLFSYWQMFKDKGCQGIICQSTNGLAYQGYYRDTAPIIKEQGFLFGSYHYYREHIRNMEGTWVPCSPTRQAENYYNWVTRVGVPFEFPPALDVEFGGNPHGVSFNNVMACLRHIEKMFGRIPMVYTSPNVARSFARAGLERYPLWLAHYTTEDRIRVPQPWKTWTIWQFSDKITYDKVNARGVVVSRKPIDHNWFNGSLDDLYNFILNSGGVIPSTQLPAPVPTPQPTSNPQPQPPAPQPPAQPPVPQPPAPPPAPQPVMDINALETRVSQAIDEWVKTL